LRNPDGNSKEFPLFITRIATEREETSSAQKEALARRRIRLTDDYSVDSSAVSDCSSILNEYSLFTDCGHARDDNGTVNDVGS